MGKRIYNKKVALAEAKRTGKLVSTYCSSNGQINETYGTVEAFDLNDTYSIWDDKCSKPTWMWPSTLDPKLVIKLTHYTMTDSRYSLV